MGFLQDFSAAFSPAWQMGMGLGAQAAYHQQQMDLERRRLGLERERWNTQRPMYEAEAALKNMQAEELKQAMAIYPHLASLLAGAPSATPQGGTPPAGGAAPGGGFQAQPGVGKNTGDLLDYWGRWYGLDDAQRAVLPKIAAHESGGNQWAHNRANKNGTDDFGLMQINSSNMGMLGPGENIFDPPVNTRIGTKIFADALNRSGGDVRGALGAYNSGSVNPSAPYVSRVLGPQPMQLAAGGNTASDVPPGYGGGGPALETLAASGTTGQQVVDPRLLRVLVQLSAQPGPMGQRAQAIMGSIKSAQDLMFTEDPVTRRSRDAQADIEKQRQIESYKWQNDPSQPLVSFQNLYKRPFDPTNESDMAAMARLQTILKTPQTVVNMNSNVQTEEDKEYGKFLNDNVKATYEAAVKARDTLDRTAVAQALLPSSTGSLEPMKVAMGATLLGFGIDPQKLGLDRVDDLAKAQAFQAVMQTAILSRATDMKGNLSDKDVKFLERSVPSLGNTPGANKVLLEFSAAVARRDIEKFEFYQDYRDRTGSAKGVDRAWREHVQAQPSIIENISKGAGINLGAQPQPPSNGTLVQGPDGRRYRVRNGQPVLED